MHLFLIDHDPVGLFEDRLDQRMQIVGLLVAVLAGDEARNVVHRARAVEGDDGDDVLEAVGMHLLERIAHARTFELEHADRVALPEHVDRSRHRRSGILSISNAGSRTRMSFCALSMTVSVLRPRKSNLTSPAFSTYFMLNWVAGSDERGSR